MYFLYIVLHYVKMASVADMFFTRALRGNLNKRHWDRRIWEVGYRGPLLPQQKATGRPDYPVSPNRVEILRERMEREFGVMKLLARPYVSEVVENDYFESRGVTSLEDIRQEEAKLVEAQRMPGKAKRIEGSKNAVRRKANVGNLLHQNRTIEDSLSSLINRNRWD